MKCYAFDVDETLEVSNGPVTLGMLQGVKAEGHIVGICGNWAHFVRSVFGWQHLISFVNCAPPLFLPDGTRMDKTWFMQELAKWTPADEFILVGNVLGEMNSLGFKCGSDDKGSAERAGWRFIKEDDFAKGVR